jgi:hypothetical protein
LELILSVNSTAIPSENTIDVSVQLESTLMTESNLTASANWPVPASAGPCDTWNSSNKLFSPVGIAIFKGNYGLNNVTSASPIRIWAAIECIVDLAVNARGTIVGVWTEITSYSLLPGLDNGSQSGWYRSQQTGNQTQGASPTELSMDEQIYASNGTVIEPYNSLQSALPSLYTVAAADEWGQLVLQHFQVVASHNLPVVGEFLSNPGGCTASGYPVPCITDLFSEAFLFNCASAAATTAGCKAVLKSTTGVPPANYTITVRYPRPNLPGEPAWANCVYNERGEPSIFGYCFMVNSTTFAFSEGGPA